MAERNRIRRKAETSVAEGGSEFFAPTRDETQSSVSAASPVQAATASPGEAAIGHSLSQYSIEASDRGTQADPVVQRALAVGGIHDPVAGRPAVSSGAPLPMTVQRQLETSFGQDLSGVRVHADSEADALSRSVSARAFTTGSDIFFRSGTYNPGSPGGMRLLAHEATHVVQQKQGVSLPGGIGQAGDAYEQHADAVAGRVAAGQPATDLLGAGSPGAGSAGAAVQRAPDNGAKGGTAVAAPPAPAEPATAAGPATGASPGAPAPTTAQGKTVNITLTALYENVPGEAKDKVKRADSDDALWFDPLTMLSNYPTTLKNTKAVGVVAGGQKTVDRFPAPVTEGATPAGRGSISAELKYASERNKSFDVQVTGVPDPKLDAKATVAARKIIEREMGTYGDVDEIAKAAEAELAPAYPGAKVSISTVKNKVMDAGQSTFFYKVRNDSGILMEVQVVPVGEKQTKYSGSSTAGKANENESSKKTTSESETTGVKKNSNESERKTETSKELVETRYNEAVVRTLEDYVTKSTTVHTQLASDLSETVIKDQTYHKDETWKENRRTSKVEDYTKGVESGQKDKENWAAKAKKIIKGAKKLTSIPYIDKIPGVGWFTRKVKGWQLDVAEWVADQFAETGKVNYEDTTIQSKSTTNDNKDGRDDVNIKRHDEEETKRKLREDYVSQTKDDWERHLTDITTTIKEYKSLTQKDSASTTDKTQTEDYSKTNKKEGTETADRRSEAEHKSTTTTFEVSQTWKYTAPVIKARVVSGDAQVDNVAFPPEADEKAATK